MTASGQALRLGVASARVARTVTSAGLTGWGLLLLARPAQTVHAVTGGAVPSVTVVRLLGARRVAQHVVVGATSSATVAWAAVATDVLHAVSMVAGARIWPAYRRAELVSAAIAAGSAVATALVAVGGRDRSQEEA